MRKVKITWLEILFVIIELVIVVVSWTNLLSHIQITKTRSNVLQESKISLEIESLDEYLADIKLLENCTAIFAVKDIQGFSLTQKHVDGLKCLGFEQADMLLEHQYHNFIGIYSDGEVAYQYIGGDEASVYRGYINNHYAVIKSETLHSGNKAIVYIDNVDYSTNVRGINIVVLDNETDTIIDSIGYDTHMEEIPVYRLQDGEIVMVYSATEGVNNE